MNHFEQCLRPIWNTGDFVGDGGGNDDGKANTYARLSLWFLKTSSGMVSGACHDLRKATSPRAIEMVMVMVMAMGIIIDTIPSSDLANCRITAWPNDVSNIERRNSGKPSLNETITNASTW